MLMRIYNLKLSRWVPVVAISLLYASTGTSFAAEILEGPVRARIIRVVDGDTLAVKAQIWVGHEIRVMVRVNGIDTPELKGRCVHERRLAQFARRYVIDWMGSGDVKLTNIRLGKYAGRIIADVYDARGHSLADDLLHTGLGYVYFGGRKSSWCAKAKVGANSKASRKNRYAFTAGQPNRF